MASLKGVSKKIIEINEPEHEFIEKVYIVLKPNSSSIKISKRKSEAESYVSNLVCWRKTFLPLDKKLRLIILGTAALFAITLALYFIL